MLAHEIKTDYGSHVWTIGQQLGREVAKAARGGSGLTRTRAILIAIQEHLPTAAERCFEAVRLAQASSPEDASDARLQELLALFDQGLEALATEVQAVMPGVGGVPVTDEAQVAAAERERTVSNATRAAIAESRKALKPRVRAFMTAGRPVIAQNIQIGDGAMIGSFQANSPGASATVSQTIQQSQGESAAELIAAIRSLAAIVNGSDLPPQQREEVAGALETAVKQIESGKPNSVAIGGLLKGCSDAVSTIRHAPEAAQNVFAAWEAFKTFLGS